MANSCALRVIVGFGLWNWVGGHVVRVGRAWWLVGSVSTAIALQKVRPCHSTTILLVTLCCVYRGRITPDEASTLPPF